MRLYEITDNYRQLFDAFDNADELSDDEIQAYFDTLEAIEGDFNIKAENIACFIKELTGDSKNLADEIAALKARKTAKDKLIERLKAMILNGMQTMSINKIDRPRARLLLRNNPQSVFISNEYDFVKWARKNNCDLLKFAEPEISKTAVKQALQNGEKIPGAELVRTVSVTIK